MKLRAAGCVRFTSTLAVVFEAPWLVYAPEPSNTPTSFQDGEVPSSIGPAATK